MEFERKGGLDLLATARLPELSTVEFHIVTKSAVRNAPPNVVVHRDLDPRSDALLELYASSSIFELPTMADYSPIAVCEAMAMELPVVTTAVGVVGEMVEDGVNGFVIPAGMPTCCERDWASSSRPRDAATDGPSRTGDRRTHLRHRRNADRIAAVLHTAGQRAR